MADTPPDSYRPRLPTAEVEEIRRWHEDAYREMRARGAQRVEYLGLTLDVPADVFGPTPMSDLLGRAVLGEVREGDRVLDMGTGCGVNAVLAASRAGRVLGIDCNPDAVAAAQANAARNGVADRTTFRVGDVFDGVGERFDLIVFDPPFRWFRPRDALEASIADEGYRALTRFMTEAPEHLAPGGRILLFFGTSGDAAYLDGLVDRVGYAAETVASRVLERDGSAVAYTTRRLSLSD